MGGATVHPRRIAAAPLGRGGLQAAFEAGVTADDWRERGLTSGAHELRLTAANIVLARTEVALQTIEPALEWPGSVGPRPAPDPLAGTGSDPRDQILPVRSACAEPIFRTPPVLRAVVWRGNDPDTPDDDVFEPVASVFPGWPFLIEARFAPGEAAEASYVVTVAGIGGVKVHRTDRDPQVFRSAIVTVQRPAAAEGVGRR